MSKLPKSKKTKRNIIIAIILLLLIIGSCEKDNSDNSKNSETTKSVTETTTKTTQPTTTTIQTTQQVTTEKITTETTTIEETIEVSDFRGMNFFDAKKQYEFNFKIKKYLPNEEYPDFEPNDIINQDIEPGTKLKKGDTIFVEVCKKETPTTTEQPTTEETTAPPPVETIPETVPPETVPPTEYIPPVEPVVNIIHFILNTETNCVHINRECSAAQKILPENYAEIDIPDNELSNYTNFYWACGKCSKQYSDFLPKF